MLGIGAVRVESVRKLTYILSRSTLTISQIYYTNFGAIRSLYYTELPPAEYFDGVRISISMQ